jgi:phosphoribosylformimino-5-aminoimidazole carboxamide ribonucleotide (ProFAR) isomerase
MADKLEFSDEMLAQVAGGIRISESLDAYRLSMIKMIRKLKDKYNSSVVEKALEKFPEIQVAMAGDNPDNTLTVEEARNILEEEILKA